MSTRSLPRPKPLEPSQDDTFTNHQLTVQGFLHDLYKPVTSPSQRAEPAQPVSLQPITSIEHENLLLVGSEAITSGPALLDPPESIPSETDSDQVLSPALEARKPQSPSPKGADKTLLSMKIPKVVRTYTRRIKHQPPVGAHSSTLSPTRSSTHEGGLLAGLINDGSDTLAEQSNPKERLKNKPAKKRTSATSQTRKRQTPQATGDVRRGDRSVDDGDLVRSVKRSKIKQKKRRAPVNEIALVTRPPCHEKSTMKAQKAYDSDDAIDLLNEYLGEEESSASILSSCAKSRKSMRPNVGRPVTSIRQEITVPQREVLVRKGFKVLPNTPRATKSPGWKLGSGFDGITFEPSTNKGRRTSRARNVGHAKTPVFLGRSLPKLELSNRLSPTHQFVGQRDRPTRQKDQVGHSYTGELSPDRGLGTADGAVNGRSIQKITDTSEKATFVQVANLTAFSPETIDRCRPGTAPPFPQGYTVKKPIQLHLGHRLDSDVCQAIREPSKSERKGWLKRKRVNFAVANEGEEEQLFVHTQTISVNAGDHERNLGRDRLNPYFEEIARIQCTNLEALNRRDYTTINLERLATRQGQHFLQKEPSTKQHRCRISHGAEEESSEFDDKIHDPQIPNSPPEPPLYSDSEVDFSTSPSHLKSLSTPNPCHFIHVPRTSEIPETQENTQESIELLDHTGTEPLFPTRQPSMGVVETALDSGTYFAKAIQRLESAETERVLKSHAVMRRRSRREPVQDVRGERAMLEAQDRAHYVDVTPFNDEQRSLEGEGALQLGGTPRLQRRISNMPFRPPFKVTV